MALLQSRWANAAGIALSCIAAGSIQLFPLVSVPLAKNLRLTGAQASGIVSAALAGQYLAAAYAGKAVDKRGPGSVSAIGALLFALSYSLLHWRYRYVTSQEDRHPEAEWIVFAILYFMNGAATACAYISSIVASTKSYPSRHSGLAIGIPCSLFGLSPLFLSPIATFFTSRTTHELDPGKWFAFLAIFLFSANAIGASLVRVLPWEEDPASAGTSPNTSRIQAGGVSSDEQAPLLGGAQLSKALKDETSQSLGTLISDPTFWLFGTFVLLAIGPCEMVMASFGSIIEALLGIHIQSDIDPNATVDTRALALRTLHVQLISVANTVSRLVTGAVSDWLSYSDHPPRIRSRTPRSLATKLAERFRRPPKISRLAFVLTAALVLSGIFAYVALDLSTTRELFILSLGVGWAYGSCFTLVPAVLRTVYPTDDFGRNFGLINWFSAIGAVMYTPLYGALADRTAKHQGGSVCYGRDCWRDAFLVSAVSAFLAAAIVVFLWRKWWKGRV